MGKYYSTTGGEYLKKKMCSTPVVLFDYTPLHRPLWGCNNFSFEHKDVMELFERISQRLKKVGLSSKKFTPMFTASDFFILHIKSLVKILIK